MWFLGIGSTAVGQYILIGGMVLVPGEQEIIERIRKGHFVTIPRDNLTATAPPVATDDDRTATGQYRIGSKWIDVTNDKAYVCVDDTENAAVWQEVGGTGPGGGDVTKVGTPVNNELGVWTGDGTIEGDTALTWDGTALGVTGVANISQVRTARQTIASATSLVIPETGNTFYVTGTTTISGVTSSAPIGTKVTLTFEDELQLTNTTGLNVGFDITTVAGDSAELVRT